MKNRTMLSNTYQYQLRNEIDRGIKCIICDAQPVVSVLQWIFVQHSHLGIENPSQPRAMYDLYMTHSDIKLGLVYDDDEISRAQNKNGSERVEKHASPSTCSFELDLQV